MELRDAGRRILWHYKILLLLMCIGALAAFALAERTGETYIATARLVVSTTPDSGAGADSVAAIATSIDTVKRALDDQRVRTALAGARVTRDPSTVAAGVSVREIGTSGIVQLSVTDPDPSVAIALTNALTDAVHIVMNATGLTSEPLPYPVEDAVPATTRSVSTDVVQDMALGVLGGLVLGLLLVALMEAFRPTVIGEDAIATEIGAPVLAVVPTLGSLDGDDLTWVRWQLDASAKRANIDSVELTAVGPQVDVTPLSKSLSTAGGDADEAGLTVHALEPNANGQIPTRTAGLVIVAPIVLKRADLERVKDLMDITGWPPVGVIGYRSKGSRGRGAKRTAPEPAEQAA